MNNEETIKETTSTTKDGITVEETRTVLHLAGGDLKKTRIALTKGDVRVLFWGYMDQESHQRGQSNDAATIIVRKNGERVGRPRNYAHYASGLAKAYELIRKN